MLAAGIYARRITQLPHQVAQSQVLDTAAHKRRVQTSYATFEASEAKPLIAFIDAASLRTGPFQVNSHTHCTLHADPGMKLALPSLRFGVICVRMIA